MRTNSIFKAAVQLPEYYFPINLWNALADSGGIWMEDDAGNKFPFASYMEAAMARSRDPGFAQMELLISAVRSLLWKYMIPIAQRVREKAEQAIDVEAHRPMLAIHIRGTDKHQDSGLATILPSEYDSNTLRSLIEKAQNRTGVVFRSIFLLTDEGYVLKELRAAVSDMNADMAVLTLDVHGFLASLGLHMTAECPHKCITKQLTKAQHEEFHSYLYQQIWIAGRADYFIGTGTSGVSQAVAQHIGMHHQLDGDSLSYWIEDHFASAAPSKKQRGRRKPIRCVATL